MSPQGSRRREQIGGVEIRVSGRLATDPCSLVQVTPDEGRYCRSRVRLGQDGGQARARKGAIFDRREAAGGEMAMDGGGVNAAVSHADARASYDMGRAPLSNEPDNARPEDGQSRAGAIFKLDAGTSDLDKSSSQVAKSSEIELTLAAEGSKSLGGLAGEQAACTDDPPGPPLPQQQVIAPWIEEIPLSIQMGARARRAHLLDKHAVAKSLSSLDAGGCFGIASRKAWRAGLDCGLECGGGGRLLYLHARTVALYCDAIVTELLQNCDNGRRGKVTALCTAVVISWF
jgi:hypothetical protein